MLSELFCAAVLIFTILCYKILIATYFILKFKLLIFSIKAIFAILFYILKLLLLPGNVVFVYIAANLLTAQTANFVLLVLILTYFIFNIFMYLFWGSIGIRGIFFVNECLIAILLLQLVLYTIRALRTNIYMSLIFGEFMLHDDLLIVFIINLDLLATIGAITVLILTAIVLTFGVEYLSREAFAYNVLVILGAFSASIVWFIITYDFGMMLVFWELSGFFSLLLVDTFYSRVRTTQAVTRTFAIGRFSDYAILLGVSEILSIFECDSLSVIFACVEAIAKESTTLVACFFESPALLFVLTCFYLAASCKCAQFMLFVWLPDAMEAPTPASALIHSSTLVVMGIFMLLRLMPLFGNSTTMLTVFMLTGGITIVYGAISSTQTSDLKKAVAYSTISQVGYLYCGCGLLAVNETLIYLVVHAICKAMLFIFVGYVVHLFGGTTSMRKMGGIFYIIPDIAMYVFILCGILAGAPYTVGFFAKELIVAKLLSCKNIMTFFIISCWFIAFLCTPIYLFRICVMPFFGRPRATWYRFKNVAFFKNRESYFSKKAWNSKNHESSVKLFPLFFFYNNFRHTLITSRLTMFLHFIILINVLVFGEFIFLLITGYFNTAAGFTMLTTGTFKLLFFNYLTCSSLLMYQIQLLILILLFSVTLYFVGDIKFLGKNSLRFLILLVFIVLLFGLTLLFTGGIFGGF